MSYSGLRKTSVNGQTPDEVAKGLNGKTKPAKPAPPPSAKEQFIQAHFDDANSIAKDPAYGQTVSNLLGISGLESGWGNGPFARDGRNNYFAEHSPAPLQSGSVQAKGDPKVHVATFKDYKTSLRSFLIESGQLIRGKTDPFEFAKVLQDAGKYGINPDGSKVATYVNDVGKTIVGVRKYLDAHGMK